MSSTDEEMYSDEEGISNNSDQGMMSDDYGNGDSEVGLSDESDIEDDDESGSDDDKKLVSGSRYDYYKHDVS